MSSTIRGTPGNDLLIAEVDRRTIEALDGDDTLIGGPEVNYLYGGRGTDLLIGRAGDDRLNDGDPGFDVPPRLSFPNDTLRGGSGDDLFFIEYGVARLIGGPGEDWINGLNGLSGTRMRERADGTLVLNPGNGLTEVVIRGIELVAVGVGSNVGPGQLIGDRVTGGSGDDRLAGRGLPDSVLQLVSGGLGDDVILGHGRGGFAGGAGDDLIRVALGPPVIRRDGRAEIEGGAGSDVIRVATAVDPATNWVIDGDARGPVDPADGNDRIVITGAGGVNARGQAGDDTIRGGDGRDTLRGQDGDDLLSGRGGDDNLGGGDGRDILDGGAGRDTLEGGADADLFRFRSDDASVDRILDFELGIDRIELGRGLVDGRLAAGPLEAAAFTQDAAAGPSPSLVYRQADGALIWDADGAGADPGVLLLLLPGAPPLTAADIVIGG